MTFAIAEIVVYIVLAALLGIAVGYFLWHRRIAKARTETNVMASALQERSATLSLAEHDLAAALDDRDRLRADYESLATEAERTARELEVLRGQISQLKEASARVPDLRRRLAELEQTD